MKLVSAQTRILVGIIALVLAAYLTLFTEKDYGQWIALGGGLISAGLVNVFKKKPNV
jgi:hypothetical protein